MGDNPVKKKIRTAGVLLVTAAMLATLPAGAAQNLSTVVVTASRIAEDPARTSADITIISEEEIERAQADSVAELLRHQAGINIASTGGPGKSTSLYMRGGNSGHVLVLINGVRVGAASTGAFDWSLISPEDVERIEVVRGPQSSLYGADAMSGVIQIFTKSGEGARKLRFSGEGGSLSSWRGQTQLTGSTEEGLSYALTASGRRTAGVSVAANGSEADPFRQTQLSGRFGMDLGDATVELTARQVEGRNGLDGGWVLADTLNWNSNSRQSVFSAKISYPLLDNWESSLQVSRSADDVTGHDPANAANNSDIHTVITQLNWQNHVELGAFSLLAGIDYHADRAVNQLAPFNKTLSQAAGFAALSWHGGMLDINASLRHDRNKAFSDKTTWHAGLALHPVSGLKISANYGTGFKAPSINDLYWPGSGNANLKPETSHGWDAGISYQRQSEAMAASFSAVWFDQRFRDLIAWAPITPGSWTWIPSNVNKAHNRGLELAARFSISALYLQANWSYLLAKDSAAGTWLARRAKESANLLIGADIKGLNVEAMLAVVGPRFSSPGNAGYMAGYRKSDLRARYKINATWELTARLDNIENKKYEEASGYGVLGRTWYAGAGATF